MSEEKPRTTEAQKRAKRKYMEKFVEIKVRMTPERRSAVQAHAEAQGESTTGFINRAIDETMPLLGPLVRPQRENSWWGAAFHRPLASRFTTVSPEQGGPQCRVWAAR